MTPSEAKQVPMTSAEAHRAYKALFSIKDLYINRTEHSLCGTQMVRLRRDSWRVIGITPKALQCFAENDFKRLQGHLVTRSHLINRADFWSDVLEFEHDEQSFYSKLLNADMTVLAHKSENARIARTPYIKVPDDLGLFRPIGFQYVLDKAESNWMREKWSELQESE